MSVSDKFYNFNKRPFLGGLYGKAAVVSTYKAWLVYTDCNNTSSFYLYTTYNTPTLDTGVIVYTDSALTTPFGTPFQFNYGNAQYNIDGSGSIAAGANVCHLTWSLWDECNSSNGPSNYYTAYTDTVLAIGVQMYQDESLTVALYPGSLPHPWLVDAGTLGYRYYLSNSGVINDIGACPVALVCYENCTQISISGTFYVPFTLMPNDLSYIPDGTIMYYDKDYSSNLASTSFVYNGYHYTYIAGSGSIKGAACST